MSNTTTVPAFAVVSPQTDRTSEVVQLAPRLATLEGKTLAFVWDYIFRGDEVWETLKEELAARYPSMTFIDYGRFGSIHGSTAAKSSARWRRG